MPLPTNDRGGSGALLWIAVLVVVSNCGCTSRWAMNEPEYAARYSHPYGDDKLPRMAQQVFDARHVEGKGGVYVSMGGQTDPTALGGEIGLFAYPTSWLSGRVGLAGVSGTSEDKWFTGGTLGLRVQPPTRLAPYAGLGGFVGAASESKVVDDDWVDNDNDGTIDERGERATRNDGTLSAIYPEAGVHFWLNPRTRLSTGAAYYLTSQGRDDDFWFYNAGISVLLGP